LIPEEDNMSVINAIKDVMFWLVVFPLVVVVAVIGGTLRVLVDMGQ
jgi:membrane protein required for beta-lactamase induction